MKLPGGVTAERALALGGVAGLMTIFLACVAMIAGLGGDESEPSAIQVERTATPSPTPRPERTPKPLTAKQKADRRAAVEIVESKGFEVVRMADYNPRRVLRVLIGEQPSPPNGQMAFFFVNDRYMGNDTTDQSVRIRVRRQRNRQITLAYSTYEPGDRACCPKGGRVNVRFVWDGSALTPVDGIPSSQVRNPAYHPQ